MFLRRQRGCVWGTQMAHSERSLVGRSRSEVREDSSDIAERRRRIMNRSGTYEPE